MELLQSERMVEERILTPKQLAARVGLTKRQINKLIGDGEQFFLLACRTSKWT
jgi:DNA-binding Xre family transcriptional regulator